MNYQIKTNLRSLLTGLSSRYVKPLKQKKTIIKYKLNLIDISDLDDFTTMKQIDKVISIEFVRPEWLISKCFSDSYLV